VWTSFGLIGASLLLPIRLESVVYAVLSLTLIRMIPVGLALLGTGYRRPTIAFIGWFGPRGLASVVFLIIGIDGLAAAAIDPAPYSSTVAWTILLSVLLHGLTSGPLARRYGRFVVRLPDRAVERASLDELPAERRTWVHPAMLGSPSRKPEDPP
jgi:NhaP-type Na+/H+ or K+/H+ antiporter